MTQGRQRKHQACAFCEAHPAGSVDHIPPVCFFPDPLPTDLITVPCCSNCNNGFSKDDLYIRNVIACREDVVIQPKLSGVKEKVLRSLDKPGSAKLRSMIGSTLYRGPIRLKSGLYLPDQHVYFVNKPRLLRWLKRILRGLYYHENGAIVPPSLIVTPALGEDWPEWVKQFAAWFRNEPLRKSGTGIFEYKWMRVPDKPEASIWCLELYHCVRFLGFIFPPCDQVSSGGLAAP